ncbi:MAG: tetratricopeptide repeat protein [Deltaproteobacteria bacterium]|nr:tetratricopeptide repeat protein [Deltaproteobacteria bacterium]
MCLLRSVALLALALVVGGCGASGLPDAQSVESQSQAEYDLGRDAFERRQYREALGHVEKALGLREDNAEACYLGAVVLLAFCAHDTGSPDCRFAEAERYVRRALEADPKMRDAQNVLGVVLVHLRRPGEAIAVLEPLANDMLYGSPEKAWGNLGWAYLEAGRVDAAIAALRRAVAAQPLFCVGHFRLGEAYLRKGEYAAARKAYTSALDIEKGDCPRLQDAFWGRAQALLKLGLETEAREDLARCRDVSSETPTGRRCSNKLQVLNRERNSG